MKLENKDLKIEFCTPFSDYTGSRFDQLGICKQVTLHNKSTFLTVENFDANKKTTGIGLSNEFGIKKPIGFDEASLNESFLKIGVGNIKKTHSTYDFATPYTFEPCKITIKKISEQKIQFSTQQQLRDYGLNLSKTFSIHENKLTIDYYLENIGAKDIETTEYYHNFFSFNNLNIDPHYFFKSNIYLSPHKIIDQDHILDFKDQQIQFKNPQESSYYLRQYLTHKEPIKWSLQNKLNGLAVTVHEDFQAERFAIWGTKHVISPECFIKIKLQPNQTSQWSRVYTFTN